MRGENVVCPLLNAVEQVRRELGIGTRHRDVIDVGQAYVLREPASPYMGSLGPKNAPLKAKDMGDFQWKSYATRT
jgi:hypothetical protein